MAEPQIISDFNVMTLLMDIKTDVSAIKTDLQNFKDSQQTEKIHTQDLIQDLRNDFAQDVERLQTKMDKRFNSLQTIQNDLVGEVDILKNKKDKEDAEKWRKILSYILTALGSIFVAKFPDIIKSIISIVNN